MIERGMIPTTKARAYWLDETTDIVCANLRCLTLVALGGSRLKKASTFASEKWGCDLCGRREHREHG